MNRLTRIATVLILLVGCTAPTSLTQAVTDAQAIVAGAEAALPAFAPFLKPDAYTQVTADLGKAYVLAAKLPALADQVTQATNIQGVLNLVSGIGNVIAANLPQPPPANVATAIAEFQVAMALVQAVAPIVAPFVGQKAGGTTVPLVFRSTMSAADARAALAR